MLMRRKANFRPPKKVIIILCDKTEKGYFRNFKNSKERDEGAPTIRLFSGKGKDPIGLIRDAKYIKENEYEGAIIEKFYCVYDVDETPEKALKSSEEESKKIGVIPCVSNPCLELWYLLHYIYSTANLCSYDELKEKLLDCIPDYEKNRNYWNSLHLLQSKAISNAKQLEKHHSKEGTDSSIRSCNPSTKVYELVEYLNEVFEFE